MALFDFLKKRKKEDPAAVERITCEVKPVERITCEVKPVERITRKGKH